MSGTGPIRKGGKDWYNLPMNNRPFWQVGLNAHLLSREAGYRSAGIHGYICQLIRHLPAVPVGEDLHYTVFLGEGTVEPGERLTVARSRWRTGPPLGRILWEQMALPLARVDLLHGLAFVTPLVSPWPTVVTVYDLSFVYYPDAFPPGRRAYLYLFTRLSCRRARRIIAISESTRRDLVKQWNLPAGKIEVAYPGVGEEYCPLPIDQVAAFRAQRGLPEELILHVGTLQPRKNLVRLIRAYRQMQTDAPLALVGGRGWQYEAILTEIEKLGLTDKVIMPGYVPADELPLWYNAASVLAYPSLYEGFGLPVVEAMACGTPVVTSSVSSMPEAAGGDAGAALLVSPDDSEALAEALNRVLTEGALREEMRSRGLRQSAGFSWQRTAAATVTAYQRALGQG
jgi:glycosyltransferase involved in cell wall biosynthesis